MQPPRVLNNASITLKSLLSAVIGAAALVGVALLAVTSFMQLQRADELQGDAVTVMAQARGASTELASGQAALYRAINLKSQNVEVGLVRAARTDFTRAAESAQKSLAAVRSAGLPIDAQILARAKQAVADYAAAAGQAASFVEEDAFNATMFMTGADEKFAAAQKASSALVTVSAQLADALDAQMNGLIRERLTVISIGAGGAVLVTLVLSVLLSRLVTRPILAMTAAMRRLAGGDLAAAIPAVDRTDEVGQMAQALLVFRDNAEAARALQAKADQEHAAKARRQAAMDRHTQEFGTSTAGVMANLARSAQTMRETAAAMSSAAQQTRASAARAAEGATTTSSNLSSVAAAAEEMSASINEISHQVSRVTQSVGDAVSCASTTDAKVAGMATAADRVGDVARLITDIAGRTNLLALNATIEAARAGEAGKGFAVVANEVKALAAQTAKATEEISTQITAIRAATGDAVTAVRAVSAAIGQVSEVATAIAAAVEQQAAATRDIAATVQTVTAATADAAHAVQEVSAISESTDAASGMVLTGADDVGREAETIRDEVTGFLRLMANDDEGERRRYERIAGGGLQATLRIGKGGEQTATIQDVSRGGISLRCAVQATAGTEATMVLPGAGQPLPARVVRADAGVLALAFHQDDAVLRRVDAVLDLIARGGDAAAANRVAA
jgi:methyl-accepting chemotaxis protein